MTRSVLEVTPHLSSAQSISCYSPRIDAPSTSILTVNSSDLDEPDIASISSDSCNGDQESANEENRFEVISIHSSESSTKRKEKQDVIVRPALVIDVPLNNQGKVITWRVSGTVSHGDPCVRAPDLEVFIKQLSNLQKRIETPIERE